MEREFSEVESGRKTDEERPQLAAALDYCKRNKATLVIAKLDRLARNAEFLLRLQNSGAEFVCCDCPNADRFTVGILALVAQRELSGYLYVDIDGMFGRFGETDRDLLGMLASQAAVALDNAQWSQGLEQKVAERTAELQASNALIEQRANELAIINSIQEGMAAELDFQAIVDLVGDKLREVFATGDVQIRWLDEAATHVHAL